MAPMATPESTHPDAAPVPAADALAEFGRLYRNAAGHEVWRIHDLDGSVYVEDIASDFDARWLAEQVAARRP